MRVILTGGAGYIGSHTAVLLMQQGHQVHIFDDFSNAHPQVIERITQLAGARPQVTIVDLANQKQARQAFTTTSADAIIHFAGLKAVGESVADPTRYYRTNINSTLNVLEAARAEKINKLVFSSSATVYGQPQQLPIPETHPVGVTVTNPYGWTKAMNEQIIRDFAAQNPEFTGVLLRYFNPIGAHESGLIGEDPSGIPNNLMPFVSQVAVGKREKLGVFGNEYPTPDGTGVRDYIHVMDLAAGHIAALNQENPGVFAYNLGSGVGVSVLELVAAFEQASGQQIPYQILPARSGDVAEMVADPTLANQELNWQATHTLADACRDSWRWQSQNPNGYADETADHTAQ